MILKDTYEQDGIHAGWEAAYRGNPLQDRLNAVVLDRILACVRPPRDALFLDAGCGVGYHTLAIARRGYRCAGIDISESILEQAERNLACAGLACRVSFRSESLEDLSFAEDTFDVIHCRGVLMHIPDWERALAQLCRVLKPGGKIVVLESNTDAVETALVRLVRQVRAPRSRLTRTPGGLEFWAEKDGLPMVTRIADVAYLVERLRVLGVRPLRRLATEFWDVHRFAAGFWRDLAIRFNRLWLALRLPAGPSIGNAVIGEKLSRR
ncbi:MAG: class I SAM-dependent methyltransferase [Gemmataceae bacterium]|nr:class I SAM-dependent methyltransferase [Gemmataceae bacterium]